MSKQDTVIATKALYKTTDYAQFKKLVGNRPVNETHVKRLAKKMESEGNLMDKFPVRVNKDMEVIDGQHRIQAAELNKSFVVYEIDENSNLSTVISINTGTSNWNWLNFANSYAERGNKNYQQFIDLYMKYPDMRYGTVKSYSELSRYDDSKLLSRQFKLGEFMMKDYELSQRLLAQYQDTINITGIVNQDIARAMLRFMRAPLYNHQKFLNALEHNYSEVEHLRQCFTVNDYLIVLESIRRSA